MQIFVRPGIRTAHEAPIQNPHFDQVATSSVSLDYVNRWRGQHTESTCHGDRKSCSAQHEISSTEVAITFRPGIRIAYVTTIRNRHSQTVERALVSQDSVPGPKFRRGASVLRGRGPLMRTHTDTPSLKQA
ncbi:hypothetical protein Taro_050004 [Colocasia esculenta]|uniref:Uncharacterized protein n=1 Tax=Colocasia esculenta TaxID=4460 RepID=A0A843XCB6_COLES|nr:hypothetical protein [Colocasia esculenta]